MKLQFSASQQYQLDAIDAVVSIFDGQPLAQGELEIGFRMAQASMELSERGVGNKLWLADEQLLHNVQLVQAAHQVAVSEALVPSVSDNGKTVYTTLNFTIEMETGTGKTYTFLRTIYELNNRYGFKKFVIVVPSVAIREGTIKNLEVTHDHFQSLYGNPPLNAVMYDRDNLTALRNFATSNTIQILVINIDSFSKDSNVINTVRETGVKPIEYLQATCPIVIVDEPQNFETDVRRQAIANLNPLCVLRYSATHRNLYNLVYSLNPVKAHEMGLVKEIEVDGVTSDANYSAAFIQFKDISKGKKTLKVKLIIYANEGNGVKQKEVLTNLDDDLFTLSNGREMYQHGFILSSIRADEGVIIFSNGVQIRIGESIGGLTDAVMQYQIQRAVDHHFRKVRNLKDKQVKVLTLFFIDRVSNYRDYDDSGHAQPGKFALWFEEAFEAASKDPRCQGLIPFSAKEVHNGYFSSDKTGKGKEKKEIWTDTKGTTSKDDDTYNLIMKEKERLLSLEEPLQFIFSHSALREGWDNPNVFQICTLNESKSDLKKRQEIGRGLRLPVGADGQRIMDKNVNVLTVIANETYEDFSRALQREIQDETSVMFTAIRNAREKARVGLPKQLTIENYPLLFEIWEKISQQTRYSVNFSTEELIQRCVAEMGDFIKVPKTQKPRLRSELVGLDVTEHGVTNELRETRSTYLTNTSYQLPDVYGYIQSKLDITRETIYQILIQSNRYTELTINPQMFLDNVVACIRRNLNRLMVDGVKYAEIAGKHYEMSLFPQEELEMYLSQLVPIKPQAGEEEPKTILKATPIVETGTTPKESFWCVPCDSGIESKFAVACEAEDMVKFFFKLPYGFHIPTPIGSYRPDWAVIFEQDTRIYFVVETKGNLDPTLLREVEQMKINCGKHHFAALSASGVEYKLAVAATDLS